MLERVAEGGRAIGKSGVGAAAASGGGGVRLSWLSCCRCAVESEIMVRRAPWTLFVTPGCPNDRACRAVERRCARAASNRWKHSSRSCVLVWRCIGRVLGMQRNVKTGVKTGDWDEIVGVPFPSMLVRQWI